MSSDFLAACALLLVFEGLLPALAPRQWKEAMRQATELDERTLRSIGIAALLAGLALLQWVRG